MRCTHCGANIPDDQLICPVCGAEVQIVPDYNPLEDVLAREVKRLSSRSYTSDPGRCSPKTECEPKPTKQKSAKSTIES